MKVKNILIIGGGTGGHISPGVALYEKFKENGVSAFYLAGIKDKQFDIFDDVEKGDLHFYGAPTMTKNIIKFPFFLIKFYFAIMKAKKLIKKFDINAVIGMGGYVSAPALFAAKSLGVQIFLCEQNTVPGMVTKHFSKYAERVFGTFEISKKYLKTEQNFFHAGNPIRKHIMTSLSRDEAKKAFHLTNANKVILAIGGSQGALKINELIFGLKKDYKEELKDVGIIWSTGSFSYQKYKEKLHNEMDEGALYISSYINNVGLAYRACDIAIARSGAGVIMELAAMGIPAIHIPYPYAAADHQNLNADEFVKEGAAIKIKNEDAVPEEVAPILFELLENQRKLDNMSKKAKSISKKDAAGIIVKEILKEKKDLAESYEQVS